MISYRCFKHADEILCPGCGAKGTLDFKFNQNSGRQEFMDSIFFNKFKQKWECNKCHKNEIVPQKVEKEF